MTGTWRDTLFVWQGRLQPKTNTNVTVVEWAGTWVGCQDCPDARTAPTPNAKAFGESDMKFAVATTANNKNEESNLLLYNMTKGSGWDLSEGDEVVRHQDDTHKILSNIDFTQQTKLEQNQTLVVANGENAFGAFVSAGFVIVEKEPNAKESDAILTLTLARRYLEEGDARAQWTIQELYDRVSKTDQGFRFVSDALKIRIAPWRTLDLHAATQSKRKRKRKNMNDDNDQGPPLNISTKNYNPQLTLQVQENEGSSPIIGLICHQKWVEQCHGCGANTLVVEKPIANVVKLIADNEKCVSTRIFPTVYCTESCAKAKGLPAWLEAGQQWRTTHAKQCSGWVLELDSDLLKLVQEDPQFVQQMKDAGWNNNRLQVP